MVFPTVSVASMDLRFEPEGIRRAGAHLQQNATATVQSAQRKISAAGGITLPPMLADQQAQMNSIIHGIANDVSFLSELADSFRERMYHSAAAYERVERANSQASTTISKEL